MVSYKLIFKPSVEKDLRSLPQAVVKRVVGRIEALGESPFPHGSIKLAGAEELYRLRVGDYRIVYAVDQDLRQIVVCYVRHRRDVYRRL
jgi:mRNA interferase RelE/StbE